MFHEILTALLENTFGEREVLERMQWYVEKWTYWLRSRLSSVLEFKSSVQIHLPYLFSCWGMASSQREGTAVNAYLSSQRKCGITCPQWVRSINSQMRDAPTIQLRPLHAFL
jgi:hypothetical protein